MSASLLWELMEMEAIEKYYINNAEKPGITINTGAFRGPDAKRNEWFTVWFGSGIAHYNFKNKKHARLKAEEILKTTKIPIRVRVVDKDDKLLRFLDFAPLIVVPEVNEKEKAST